MTSRILEVDDTLANIQALSTTLKGKGYRISVATNGRQALEIVGRVRPDLILLDVMMPEMDGFETCRRLKAADAANDIPAIFLTARNMIAHLKQFNQTRGTALQVRIGLNTGPVVAGVIGRSEFTYDLWGDTVNTTSRMESTGLPDRVQVTSQMQRALAGLFDLEERGEVEVKGKGRLRTWFLVGRKHGCGDCADRDRLLEWMMD